jgi:hypothetical protein
MIPSIPVVSIFIFYVIVFSGLTRIDRTQLFTNKPRIKTKKTKNWKEISKKEKENEE